ncbi:TetR family transcriptional regulator [Streptomyces sp. 71268]|uniref:TetR family transcriptional regulator n=2 Tax=unclassified Streptomyces TaxID=2593676 RepID=UPI0023F805C4|nr:TetR family transcriptional regulator [Streptomyces sp. 71268]WEV29314.1 TetR family transcriptional regulator [Streptomyces sp. 71268]
MPPDSTATKARLLAAARAEFARHGVAGARVDRIAAAAKANKRLLYVYFGNKCELFDLVVAEALGQLTDAVPFTADDLPGYAGSLFDHLTAHPALPRLIAWALLERPGPTAARIADRHRAAGAVTDARERGVVTTARERGVATAALEPVDVLALTVGLAGAWSPTAAPSGQGAPDGARRAPARPDPDPRRAERRAGLTRAMRAAAAP